jgi:hypothetical protein
MELTVPRQEELYLFQGIPVADHAPLFVRVEADLVPKACVRPLIRSKVGW